MVTVTSGAQERLVKPSRPERPGRKVSILETPSGGNVVTNPRDAAELQRQGDVRETTTPGVFQQEGAETRLPREEQKRVEGQLETQFEEAGVFKEPEQTRIIPPEQESLSVVGRILGSVIESTVRSSPGLRNTIDSFNELTSNGKEPVSQAEITVLQQDFQNGIIAETNIEIESRIVDAEGALVEIGLLPPEKQEPVKEEVLGTAGKIAAGVIVGESISSPLKEFVGTDGQIKSLELALSQYNEMTSIPARSVDIIGPQAAFDHYNRMEEDILALEEQLRISALTSKDVALKLKGRAVEARLLKLKTKIQEGREVVSQRALQEAFGEVDLPRSVSFFRQLKDERKRK